MPAPRRGAPRRRLAAVPPGATAGPARRTIDYLPLDDVVAAARNPKGHDTAGINRSIRRFGFVEPIVMDERTGRLVAGHGRVAELRALRAKAGKRGGRDLPDGIVVDDEHRWLVPVVRGWASGSDPEAEAYLAASNRLVERGGWDDAALAEMLRDLEQVDPELVAVGGFTTDDLAALMARLTGTEDAPTPSESAGGGSVHAAPALADAPISAPGDLYVLGPHRLLCGDATNPDHLTRLADGTRAACLWTDPPYGVDYVGKTGEALTIIGDQAADAAVALFAAALDAITIARVLMPGAAYYVAHPDGPLSAAFRALLSRPPYRYRQTLVWIKDALVLGHSDYHYRHEPIAYGDYDPAAPLEAALADGIPDADLLLDQLTAAGTTPDQATVRDLRRLAVVGHAPAHVAIAYGFHAGGGKRGRGGAGWYGSNAETTVFVIPRPKASLLHPTMKPIDLVARHIANATHRAGVVLDPFAGSGTTLLAAHQLGRPALALERDPRYVDVICRRWTHVTGQPPTIDGQPRTFPPLSKEEAAV